MAFSAARRSLATNLSRHLTCRPHPSLSHLVPSHHDRGQDPSSSAAPNPTQRPAPFPSGDLRRRSRSQNLPFPHLLPFPFCARRSFSTSSPPPDGVIDAVARLISDAASSVAPAFSSEEVAAAAADSFLPVAAVQHLIDAVHSITGLNWWASIALTMLLVRTATIPLLVRQIKAQNRLSALKPEIIAINKEGDSRDPQSRHDRRKKLRELLKKHGVSRLTPFNRTFLQGSIILSFCCAIRNMIEKVPSLEGGGAYWFPDLTTPDELYILPVLTSMTVAVDELNVKARIQGQPILVQQVGKNLNRALAFLIIPLSVSICKMASEIRQGLPHNLESPPVILPT
ncbi:mitochondrial inner membrane protein OXA1-like [Triticum aestivum]|uniref:mitochondrial inner membrane protein OXA1-like n=1 Tax=Triticum aestivum TaxID=4565 RepID=UPI001D021361|nr:mitochondrial inner membrane protein OXA1-like [Triticum aestivum]